MMDKSPNSTEISQITPLIEWESPQSLKVL